MQCMFIHPVAMKLKSHGNFNRMYPSFQKKLHHRVNTPSKLQEKTLIYICPIRSEATASKHTLRAQHGDGLTLIIPSVYQYHRV